MDKQGWKPTNGSLAIADRSNSLYGADKWLPRDVFRLYGNETLPNILTFISILLDQSDNSERLEFAVISAGWFDWGNGAVKRNWEYYFVRQHLLMKDADFQGGISLECPIQQQGLKAAEIVQCGSFAYPLERITSTTELNELIVQTLIEAIKANPSP